MAERKVRVRFAPSPTGALHIGGVRTALYNYLFARQHGGDLIFRIEDTDSNRFVPGAEEYILESFKWLGIHFDEGVSFGGEYGPYRQSERREIYKKYVQVLLENGKAYIAFDTPEELDAKRAEIANFQYDASTRGMMRNSLTMPKEEVDALIAEGKQYVVRFKIEPNEDVHVNDLIRGEVIINSSILDDKVLYKSADELPTYHLANIVDDHLMEVSHVIRGEEWLPSAPLHVLLYRAFGWEDTMPEFAHLPLLLKPEGNGKLSKRDGDRLGFPVFPLEWHDPKSGEISSGYRESGYLPEAVINFLALLGWNPGNDQEVMSMDELIKLFDLHRCSKSGAKFDYKKGGYKQFVVPDESYHGLVYADSFPAAPFVTKARVQMMRDLGSMISPMNAFLLNLGTETLPLRMERHSENALKVAKFLKESGKVKSVSYPALEGDKHYAKCKKYLGGKGSGVITFDIGSREKAVKFMDSLKLARIVVHVAEVRTGVLHPASSTHRQLSDEQLIAAGITPGTIRLSCGIEAVEDIIADIKQAL